MFLSGVSQETPMAVVGESGRLLFVLCPVSDHREDGSNALVGPAGIFCNHLDHLGLADCAVLAHKVVVCQHDDFVRRRDALQAWKSGPCGCGVIVDKLGGSLPLVLECADVRSAGVNPVDDNSIDEEERANEDDRLDVCIVRVGDEDAACLEELAVLDFRLMHLHVRLDSFDEAREGGLLSIAVEQMFVDDLG